MTLQDMTLNYNVSKKKKKNGRRNVCEKRIYMVIKKHIKICLSKYLT